MSGRDIKDPKLRRDVLQACERSAEEMLGFLAEAVSIPSISGEEQAVVTRFAAWFEANGFALEARPVSPEFAARHPRFDAGEDLVGRPNLHAFWGDRERPALVLNGHLDVITPGAAEAWSHPPFSGRRSEGRIYGRGSADMKAGVVAAMYAVRALREVGLEPTVPIELQCVIGEELGGMGTLYAIESAPRPTRAAIVTEPTDCVVAAAGGGVLMFAIDFGGRSTHTSTPWAGESALENLISIYEALRSLNLEREGQLEHPLFDALPAKAPFAIGTAQVGEWLATVPDHGRMAGRFGLLPGESVDAAKAMLEECVADAVGQGARPDDDPPRISWLTPGGGAWESPLEDPLIRSLELAARELDPAARLGAVTYGSDANHFAAAGVPTAVFGPGRISDAHVKDEFVEERSVVDAVRLLALALAHYLDLGADG